MAGFGSGFGVGVWCWGLVLGSGFINNWATSEARRQAGGKLREEPVCNQGIGLPIVHTVVWTTWLCTGGRGRIEEPLLYRKKLRKLSVSCRVVFLNSSEEAARFSGGTRN